MDPKIIDDTISHLTGVKELLTQLGPLTEAHAKATAQAEDAKSQLDSIQAELSDAKSGLTRAQLKNVRDYEESIFTKSQQAKALDEKIATAQSKLDTLNVHVTGAETRHKQIEDSINSLRAKLG